MGYFRIVLIGLLSLLYYVNFGQQFTSETNSIYLNPRSVSAKSVKLPLVTWISPEPVQSIMQGDSIELIARVYSSTMLKSLTLVQTGGNTSTTERFSWLESSFSGEQVIKRKIKLLNGVNNLELIAENASGGKVGSTRTVTANSTGNNSNESVRQISTPLLVVKPNSIVFEDTNNNGKLDANEVAYVKYLLSNKGTVSAKDLIVSYSLEGTETDVRVELVPITTIDPEEEVNVVTRVIGGQNLQTGKVLLRLVVMEPNGFDSEPVQIQFNTEAYKSPLITIADAVFSSISSSRLERNKTTGLKILVQNTGYGTAENVKVNIAFPENIYFVGERTIDIGNLSSGEGRTIETEFIVTSRYKNTEVPIKISLEEKYAKLNYEKTITAQLDQALSTIQFNVTDKPAAAIVPLLLRSKVDTNIPENNSVNTNRYALVIGNEEYTQYQSSLQVEQNVAFARNDASVFKEYLVKTLGVSQKNVYLLLDATRGQINRELERVSELAKLNPNSEIIIYYAGHGLPDFETKKAYIIPVDVSGTNIKDGISLSDLYAKLAATKASRVTVFLDACFSGGGRGENGLLAARTVKIKPTGDLLEGNIIVFAASSGEEVSLPLKKEGHGLFTYHLLHKFQETNGIITMDELYNYLSIEVPKSSLTENGLKQTPQILTSPKLDSDWKKWKF